jgi:hypothetical protein
MLRPEGKSVSIHIDLNADEFDRLLADTGNAAESYGDGYQHTVFIGRVFVHREAKREQEHVSVYTYDYDNSIMGRRNLRLEGVNTSLERKG